MSKKKKTLDDEIWLRQPGESEKAYAAFKVYLELGEARTITAVGQKLGKSRSFVDGLRAKFDWKNRALAYDNFLMFSESVKMRKENEKRFERFGRVGDQLLSFGATKLAKSEPDKLSHKDAISYMQLALKFAEACRDMFALKESERTRADIELLRIESMQSSVSSPTGSSNFEEAINAAAPDVWGDENNLEDKCDENEDTESTDS